MINLVFKLTLIFLISIIVGCSNDETESPAAESANADENKAAATQVPVESTKVTNRTVNYTEEREPCADYQPERKALFGELHGTHCFLVRCRCRSHQDNAGRCLSFCTRRNYSLFSPG